MCNGLSLCWLDFYCFYVHVLSAFLTPILNWSIVMLVYCTNLGCCGKAGCNSLANSPVTPKSMCGEAVALAQLLTHHVRNFVFWDLHRGGGDKDGPLILNQLQWVNLELHQQYQWYKSLLIHAGQSCPGKGLGFGAHCYPKSCSPPGLSPPLLLHIPHTHLPICPLLPHSTSSLPSLAPALAFLLAC